MRWEKKGKILGVEDHPAAWAVSHLCVPTTILLGNKIRVFCAPRNNKGQSIPTFFDVSADDPSEVLYIHTEPILSLGQLGTFDDGGIMPCCVVSHNDLLYMYYVGWNPSVSVAYRNAIGLAISNDNGVSFKRYAPGAIVDRSMHEPFFTASPWVRKEKDNLWHLWYASGTGFVKSGDRVEPLYLINYGSSKDGIHFERNQEVCIYPKDKLEANARATVFKDSKNMYHMWFAFRGSKDYRDGVDSYKIGYAKSSDGKVWERHDHLSGIEYSSEGWDSTMQTYPCVQEYNDRLYLFYNGNGFGRTGIGFAELIR